MLSRSRFALWSLRGLAVGCVLVDIALAMNTSSNWAPRRVRFATPERCTGVLSPLQTILVPFPLENRTVRMIRVVGATGVCRAPGCLIARDLPVDVPPFSTRDILIELRASDRAGPFRLNMTVFTDCPGQTTMELTVYGEVR
jgi:hypothetical protein